MNFRKFCCIKVKKIPIAEPKSGFLFRHNAMNLFKLISLKFESKKLRYEMIQFNLIYIRIN